MTKSKNPYKVVYDGLQEGATAYIDRNYTITGYSEYLEGAVYIKTANDDKSWVEDDFLSFEVDRDVTVYLAHDLRIDEKPAWVGEFAHTSDELVTSDTVFSIFSKDFSAGTIALGGNAGHSSSSMYIVIVTSPRGLTVSNVYVASGDPCGLLTLYEQMLGAVVDAGWVTKKDRVLVLCGGLRDKSVFEKLEFEDVTLSNLSHNLNSEVFAPFKARSLDAEDIYCADNEYSLVAVHAGLHHCQSPHRAILEMYRVAEKAILLVEPSDKMLGRITCKLGFEETFEIKSVIDKPGLAGGGLRHSGIPNFVYRFTTREVRKMIETNDPEGPHQFLTRHRLQVNWDKIQKNYNPALGFLVRLLKPMFLLAGMIPSMTNCVGIAVRKRDSTMSLHPWLKRGCESGSVRMSKKWVERKFGFVR